MDALSSLTVVFWRGRISIYIGAGGWAADTCLQVLASSTIRIAAVLDGRMLNQPLVDSDTKLSITHGG